MRLGLELGESVDLEAASKADAFGLWAVAVGGPAGTEMIRAARVVERSEHLRVIVKVELEAEHPFTIAEEVSVLDNLSGGRIGVIVNDNPRPETLLQFREALIGRPRDGVVLSPPTVQTEVPIWLTSPLTTDGPPVLAISPPDIVIRPGIANPGTSSLSGDLGEGRTVIDTWRDAGCTHLLVSWPGQVRVLARHLATRAASADFPKIVADLADQIEPFDPAPD